MRTDNHFILLSHMIRKWACRPRANVVRPGRHTFQKFYLKKNIIDHISRQKKHTFSMIKDDHKMMILRPFLKFSRFEFLKFCEFWYLPIIPDLTNFNVCFRRNNLRLQLIPYLKIFLNLNLFQKIDQFQQILKLENQYLQFFLKKIHGVTFYGEAAGIPGRTLKGDAPGAARRAPCLWRSPPPGTVGWASPKSKHGDRALAKGGERSAPTTVNLPRPVAWRGRPMHGAGLRAPGAVPRTPSNKGLQAANSSRGKPFPSGPIGGWQCPPLGRFQRQRAEGWKSRSGANAVSGQFSLLTDPARPPFGAHISPKSGCWPYDYRKNYFFYFPKIFQYLIIHHFYYFVRKKISFNEISCIFQKLQPQSKSK